MLKNLLFRGSISFRGCWFSPLTLLVALSAIFFHDSSLGLPGDWSEESLTTAGTLVTIFSPVTSVKETLDGSSDISSSDRKIIVLAQEDALAFVASEGRIHGAMLEQAFNVLRARGVEGADIDWAIIISAEFQVASK